MTRTLNSYRGLTTRNAKVFLKDKMAVFLSLLTQIIILGLFLLFIKNSYIDGVNSALGDLKDKVSKADTETLVNSWMISGVLGTSVITSTLSALSVIVSDKQEKIDFDYNASSVKSSVVVTSYFSGAVLCSLITSFILLAVGLGFIAVTGNFVLSAVDILALVGLVLFGSVSSTLILMLIISFFKKDSTYSAFSVLISTLVGFVVGAYFPVSQLGEGTQTAVNLVPGAQITGMIRNILVTPAIDNVDKALDGLDHGGFKEAATDMFAVKLHLFGSEINTEFMLLYSVIAVVLFAALNIVMFKTTSKRKA